MSGDLWTLSASELALRIAHGECSALEAVDAHIARIDAVNPALNAVVYERFEQARAEARDADAARAEGASVGRFHGVPVTVKESFDIAGMPSTYGIHSRARLIAEHDDPYVARLRACGAIVLGKTNLSQMMLYIESDNPLYGRTNNPWNLKRTPGGSSGGQAAIVAAGGSPFGLATDIGGSIRVPATFCGIAGMRPTSGRMPELGGRPMSSGQTAITSQVGVLARDVADVILALECLNGGKNPPSEPPRPLGDPYQLDVSTLRVGYYSRAGFFAPSPAVARAVEDAAGVMHQLGARVTAFAPPDPDLAEDLFYGILAADGGKAAIEFIGRNKRDRRVDELLKIVSKPRHSIDTTIALLRMMKQHDLAKIVNNYGLVDTAHYWKLLEAQQDYQRRFREALDLADGGPLDIVISPACVVPALPHGESRNVAAAGAYAVIYSLLGYPAGVVPITRVGVEEQIGRKRSRDRVERAALRAEIGSVGLPVGVQVVARPWREHVALAAMLAIESVVRKRPDFPSTPHFVAQYGDAKT